MMVVVPGSDWMTSSVPKPFIIWVFDIQWLFFVHDLLAISCAALADGLRAIFPTGHVPNALDAIEPNGVKR